LTTCAHGIPEGPAFTQFLPPRTTAVEGDEAQQVTLRQSDVHRGKIQPRQVLDDPTLPQLALAERTMQIDDGEIRSALHLEEMTEVEIAMTYVVAVHHAADFGDLFDQLTFLLHRRR